MIRFSSCQKSGFDNYSVKIDFKKIYYNKKMVLFYKKVFIPKETVVETYKSYHKYLSFHKNSDVDILLKLITMLNKKTANVFSDFLIFYRICIYMPNLYDLDYSEYLDFKDGDNTDVFISYDGGVFPVMGH